MCRFCKIYRLHQAYHLLNAISGLAAMLAGTTIALVVQERANLKRHKRDGPLIFTFEFANRRTAVCLLEPEQLLQKTSS